MLIIYCRGSVRICCGGTVADAVDEAIGVAIAEAVGENRGGGGKGVMVVKQD
jgi:hypothetical protein